MNRVPHCNECEYCKEYNIVYAYLYCHKQNEQICADTTIKTSPIWCPLRKNKHNN